MSNYCSSVYPQRYEHLKSLRSYHDPDLGYTSLDLKSSSLIIFMDTDKNRITPRPMIYMDNNVHFHHYRDTIFRNWVVTLH